MKFHGPFIPVQSNYSIKLKNTTQQTSISYDIVEVILLCLLLHIQNAFIEDIPLWMKMDVGIMTLL